MKNVFRPVNFFLNALDISERTVSTTFRKIIKIGIVELKM